MYSFVRNLKFVLFLFLIKCYLFKREKERRFMHIPMRDCYAMQRIRFKYDLIKHMLDDFFAVNR